MNRNAALFLVMCLVWGLTWWPVKVGAAHVPPIFLAAARFLVAGALMLAWAGRAALAVPRAARARLLATALLVNTGNYALLFWGIARAPTGLAAIVNFGDDPGLLAARQPLARRRADRAAPRRRDRARHARPGAAVRDARDGRARQRRRRRPAELWGLAAIALGTLLYCVGAVLSRPIATAMPVLALAGWQTLIGGIGLAARVARARAGRAAPLPRARGAGRPCRRSPS